MAPANNIVWITLDSVRADHTSLAGYERSTTPELVRIAGDAGGAWFENAFSSSIATPISSGSILTGTHPFRHGLRISNDYLPEELDTLPMLLGDAGYRTAGISTNSFFSSGTGLNRGFDQFKLLTGSTFFDEVPWSTIAKYAANIRRHSAGFTADTTKHATPFVMNDILKQWIPELVADDRPFFLYAHYNQTHRPYYPPLPYRDRYTDDISVVPTEAAQISLDVHHHAHEYIAHENPLSQTELDALVAMYDAEIAYTDKMVGRLFDYVQSLDSDTVFIVTADHGELLGESGLFSHTYVLRDELTNVPLVTYGLDLGASGDDFVQHVDLTRTLVEMAGGRSDQLQGLDLRDETRETVITQRAKNSLNHLVEYNPDFDPDWFIPGELTAFRDHEFKYVRGKTTEDAVLYRLPNESTDVAAGNLEVKRCFEDAVTEWLASPQAEPIKAETVDRLTSEMKQQLRDLGYRE
ncbi:sulfatase [Halobellus captivus]|uniref:sulfatase n=1 Tax=Halobellus captivus TaxID=2592614 RepID=UPI0011A2DCA9|nr:sulfatase [Halobellus captivus]